MEGDAPCPYCIDSEKPGYAWKSRTMHEGAGLIPCPRCSGTQKVGSETLTQEERKKLKKEGVKLTKR